MVRLRTEYEVGNLVCMGRHRGPMLAKSYKQGQVLGGYLNVPPQATGIKEGETLKGRE